MLINLRNALMTGKRTPTAKDYLRASSLAIWDAIENAGWESHTSDASLGVADLVGGVGKMAVDRNDITFTDNAIHVERLGRLISPTYSIGNKTLTLQYVAKNIGGLSGGEVGALWENPWFGINLRSAQQGVRFTYGTDTDYRIDVSIPRTYTLVRASRKNRFFAGKTLLGTSSRSISTINTRDFRLGAWNDGASINVNGDIYCVRLYLSALSDDDVFSLVDTDIARFNLPAT